MKSKERLTFGFKNTEILFGVLVFSLILASMLWIISSTSNVLNFIIFWQLTWGIVFGSFFKSEETLTEKGYFGGLVWGVVLISPLALLVRYLTFRKIINFINHL